MFTVILLSEDIRRQFEGWKELFLPFVEDGRIAFCEWEQDTQTRSLSSAIPELADAIRGHEEWRLLVIGTGTEGQTPGASVDPENPFDYAMNWSMGLNSGPEAQGSTISESSIPLVRLSHMLLGFPELGVRSFVPETSYWDRDRQVRVFLGEYVALRVSDGLSEEQATQEFHDLLPTRNDVQVHYAQGQLEPDEERAYRRLVKAYETRQSRPSEVVFVGVRDPNPPRPVDELRAAWKRSEKYQASRFAERNGYHPACRFMVYDLHSEDHTAYELDEFKFWLSVLTIAINDLPSSAIQTERLYSIDVSVDPDLLSKSLNEHMAQLTQVRDRLDREIRRPRTMTRLEVADYLEEIPVEVSFEHLNGDDLYVHTEGYGLASDRPSSEMVRWEIGYTEVEAAAEVFNRKPKRVLAKAVEGTRESQQSAPELDEPLTSIEKEELEEELTERVKRLSEATTRDILDRQRLHQVLRSHQRTIRRAILERMSAGTIWLASVGVGLVWLLAFVPFLWQAVSQGGVAVLESLLVVGVIALILASVALALLVLMRRKLVGLMREFNRALRGYVGAVKDGAAIFGEFLTDIETYMKGKALLASEHERSRREQWRRQRFQQDYKHIQFVIAREKALVRSVGRQIEIRRISQNRFDVASWSPEALARLLMLPVSARQCAFNKTGEHVHAPFDFVDRLSITDIALKEDPTRHRLLVEDSEGDLVDSESAHD